MTRKAGDVVKLLLINLWCYFWGWVPLEILRMRHSLWINVRNVVISRPETNFAFSKDGTWLKSCPLTHSYGGFGFFSKTFISDNRLGSSLRCPLCFVLSSLSWGVMSTTSRQPRVTHYQVCATVLPFSMSTGKRTEVLNTGPLLSRPSDVIIWSDTFQKCWNSRWSKPLCRVKSTLNLTVSITCLISTEGCLQRRASRQIVQFSSIGLTEQSA